MLRLLTGTLLSVAMAIVAACGTGTPSSPMPPPPSFVPLTDADCPVPEDIDEGAFRAAICPTIIGAVNAMRARDVDSLVALTAEESIDCETAVTEDPLIVEEFPQCGAVPRPGVTGYAWCADPLAPTCQLVTRDAFGTMIGQLLESADAAAIDEHGPGGLAVIGFDTCGPVQFLRTTLITRLPEADPPPARWIIDLLMQRRPLLAEEPVNETFLIRRIDAAAIDVWIRMSADPLREGRCGELILDALVSGSAGS